MLTYEAMQENKNIVEETECFLKMLLQKKAPENF
jgi:hypothetical protein